MEHSDLLEHIRLLHGVGDAFVDDLDEDGLREFHVNLHTSHEMDVEHTHLLEEVA